MPENNKNSRAVLLGGGEILDYQRVAWMMRPFEYLVCADSGYDHCGHLGVTAHRLVGDFDSLASPLPPHIPRLQYPAEKNYTDSFIALEHIETLGYRRIFMAGMLGGRLDHTLANMQGLAYLSRKGIDAMMTDGVTDIYAITDASMTLHCRKHCYFSLISYTQSCTGVYIQDAKYLLTDHTLYLDRPRAISNEFLDRDVTITVGDGTLMIVVLPI